SSSVSATSSAPAPTATPTAVSNVSLFLTNLRLLDLDLYPDWPDISASTFGARDAAQGQKKRIQCVEWALYRLFTLWDPDEARDKLQPFFPPLDQVQSLNLRAALLRSLEHAKKNGVLGRDAVVRKTMLDECKGERLEEVLAAFSSAVLKKLAAEQQLNEPQFPALAQTLALENRGYSGERGELVALILAHKSSLGHTLRTKNESRAKYNDFSQLMRVKEAGIARRRAETKAAQEERRHQAGVPDDMKLDVWRTVRNNWSGNERWMETLLYGDSHARKDGLLSTPFDRVWRRVEAGRLAELEENKSDGLLEQLDGRVKSQKERLEKWQGFRQRMFGKVGPEPRAEETTRQKERGIDLGFRAHENLHLGRMSPRKLARVNPGSADNEYNGLIRSLKAELASISVPAASIPAFFQQSQEPQQYDARKNVDSTSPEPEAISELSEIEDEPLPPRPSPPRREPVKAIEHVLRRTGSVRHEHARLNGEQYDFPHLRSSATIQSKHANLAARRSPSVSPTRSPERRPSPPRIQHSPPALAWSPPRNVAVSPVRTPSPERPVSPTQQLADQILASVDAASPSPIKKPRHTLSLAERTRLSMARRTSTVPSKIEVEEYDAESEIDRYHARRAAPTVSVEPPAEHNGGDAAHAEADPHEDLVARTRRSMAGFEAAQKKAQLERRRSLRKSKQIQPAAGGRNSVYFPAVDEEENSTLLLAEELMSAEVDQDTVFMSRPKIKTSP
ncbi:HAUS augmin-like complex subunit 6 N-terminus-domain-containing protein, partial [Cercophora newfieldiana]